jgi:hypothetical protein
MMCDDVIRFWNWFCFVVCFGVVVLVLFVVLLVSNIYLIPRCGFQKKTTTRVDRLSCTESAFNQRETEYFTCIIVSILKSDSFQLRRKYYICFLYIVSTERYLSTQD